MQTYCGKSTLLFLAGERQLLAARVLQEGSVAAHPLALTRGGGEGKGDSPPLNEMEKGKERWTWAPGAAGALKAQVDQ